MESQPYPLFPKKKWVTSVLLGMPFLAALGIRIYDVTDLPNDFYMVRQYRAMLMARGIYYQHLNSVPEWQRDMSELDRQPQLQDYLASHYPVLAQGDVYLIDNLRP